MAERESPKRETAGKKKKTALEKARITAKEAQVRANDEEKARLEAEDALQAAQETLITTQAELEHERKARVESERALTEAQAEIKNEHQSRLTAERALTKVKKELTDAQAEVKQEGQIRDEAEQAKAEAVKAENLSAVPEEGSEEQRVTFVVRVTADEQGQPRRTEIEHAQSRQKKSFSTLDANKLSDFIKRHLGTSVVPEQSLPTTRPPATDKVPPPGSSHPDATLTIANVKLVRAGVPGGMNLRLNPNEPFVIQVSLKLEGPEALSLTAQESGYEVQIYARNESSGTALSPVTYRGNLIKDTLDYATRVEAPGLLPGLYRLLTLVILRAPTKLAGHHEGPVFQVGEGQQAGEMNIPNGVGQPQ